MGKPLQCVFSPSCVERFKEFLDQYGVDLPESLANVDGKAYVAQHGDAFEEVARKMGVDRVVISLVMMNPHMDRETVLVQIIDHVEKHTRKRCSRPSIKLAE